MKKLTLIVLLLVMALGVMGQSVQDKKPSTFVFHMFYNDFNTAQAIRTTSLGNVLKNNYWSSISDMQAGFGFNYLKGIAPKIDFASTLDGSYTDYLYKNGTSNGSSQFLLDANAGLNLKLLTDKHPVVPYLSAGAGFSLYQGKAGVYVPVGLGLQFNLFNEAFIFTNMQYRAALTSEVNNHFQYSAGIGLSLHKKKKALIPPVVTPPAPVITPAEIKLMAKNITVTVIDAETGLPLPNADVTMDGPESKVTATSDERGHVIFNNLQPADYTITGALHNIGTETKALTTSSFNIIGNDIAITLSHNDPRFTLTGSVVNRNQSKPEGGVTVTASNISRNSTASAQSSVADGKFSIQLDAASDFTVSGKKAGFISNIERVSTKELKRSTTLYVSLQLVVEELMSDKTIALSNIYYETGSSAIKSAASPDLDKLVLFMNDNPIVKIEIASHTDSRGSAAANQKLSQARAQAVVSYLLKKGIAKSRLIPKGYGESKLINGCDGTIKCTDLQNEKNRRTEFKILSYGK
jgi:outer membrane protein OmpA-like peptidoglycan-associated protein